MPEQELCRRVRILAITDASGEKKAADLSLVLSFRQRIIYDGGVGEEGSKGISKEFRSLLLGSDKLAVRLTERAEEVNRPRPPPMHGISKKAKLQDTALSKPRKSRMVQIITLLQKFRASQGLTLG